LEFAVDHNKWVVVVIGKLPSLAWHHLSLTFY
jgi:hypothetical protein